MEYIKLNEHGQKELLQRCYAFPRLKRVIGNKALVISTRDDGEKLIKFAGCSQQFSVSRNAYEYRPVYEVVTVIQPAFWSRYSDVQQVPEVRYYYGKSDDDNWYELDGSFLGSFIDPLYPLDDEKLIAKLEDAIIRKVNIITV